MALAVCRMARSVPNPSSSRGYDAAIQFPRRSPSDIRDACGLNGSIENARALVPRIIAVQDGILRAREAVHLIMGWEPSSPYLTTHGLVEPNDTLPIDVSYWYTDPATTRVVLQCWALVIQVNSAVTALHSFLSQRHIMMFTDPCTVEMHLESRRPDAGPWNTRSNTRRSSRFTCLIRYFVHGLSCPVRKRTGF